MKYFIIIFISIFFTGCFFRSGHSNFVNNMSAFITNYNNYKKDKERLPHISDKYLKKKSYDQNGNTYYHFEHKPAFCKHDACRYFIIVDSGGKIIGWGFDPCDREKCCQLF